MDAFRFRSRRHCGKWLPAMRDWLMLPKHLPNWMPSNFQLITSREVKVKRLRRPRRQGDGRSYRNSWQCLALIQEQSGGETWP